MQQGNGVSERKTTRYTAVVRSKTCKYLGATELGIRVREIVIKRTVTETGASIATVKEIKISLPRLSIEDSAILDKVKS